MNPNPFGEYLYRYTRVQALADGVQVDITKTAAEAGIRMPVFLARAVFDAYVTVPAGVEGQDEEGRLWDLIWILRLAIINATPGRSRLPFALYVRNDHRAPRLVKLVAFCGPYDFNDPRPTVTVTMPNED